MRKTSHSRFSGLKPLCRRTFIQYSCLASFAVLHIPVKQRNCVSFSQIYSRYPTAAWKSANSPIRHWMHKSSRPLKHRTRTLGGVWEPAGSSQGSSRRAPENELILGRRKQTRLHFWRGFRGPGVLPLRPCPDRWPAVFPHRTLIMRLVSFSEEAQAGLWFTFGSAAHDCFWLKPGQWSHSSITTITNKTCLGN